jgi:hypothetical protein
MTEQNSQTSRLAAIPRKTRFIIGGTAAAVIVAALLVTVVLPGITRPFVRLETSRPSYVHPDGLVVTLPDGLQSAQVRVRTTPREVFVSNPGSDWQEAQAALPANLVPLSPLYTIDTQGNAFVNAQMAIPNGADPLSLLDLYWWDETEQKWLFVPSQQTADGTGIAFVPPASHATVMAVHVEPQPLTAALVISNDGATVAKPYQIALLEGVTIDANGMLAGQALSATAAQSMPIVTNREGNFTNYEDATRQTVLIEQMMTLITPYEGVVLDFDSGPGYAGFVDKLTERVHAHGKRLEIIVRDAPADYDIGGIAKNADRIWFAPGDDPTLYMFDGAVRTQLAYLVGYVDRNKLGLLVTGLNIDIVNGQTRTISTPDALALFGDVEVTGNFDPNSPVSPGSELPFRLSGQVASMGYDLATGSNYLTTYDESGQLHYVYFTSAQSLARKLEWARYYGLAVVAADGIAHPESPEGAADGFSNFLAQQQAVNPTELEIVWRVESASGASLSEQSGDLSLIQYLWQAVTDPGAYVISASVQGSGEEAMRGQVQVEVGEGPVIAGPTPTVTPTLKPRGTPGPTPTPGPQPTNKPPEGGIVAGQFELGGQTQSFGHPEQMHAAGMSWVKFQHKWNPGDDPSGAVGGRIADAHAKGFKILLSIPGPSNPTSIDYAAYTNFVGGVAALGPEAIEIWNEMNFTYEWPADQINGANYVTNMLAPAYTAIKAANPGVMVISGAPTPTGAFNGCGTIGSISGCDDWFYIKQMQEAGANNYMDCVGVHYNEGIIPPSQTSGDPRAFGDFYSRYFFGMLNLYYGTFGKPVCFTELGYLTAEGYGSLPSNFAWAQSTTVGQQAAWLAEAAVLSSQSGKVRLMIIFNVDFTHWGTDPQAGYGMIRPGGGCPACDALAAVAP